jgi:hypothetical protein
MKVIFHKKLIVEKIEIIEVEEEPEITSDVFAKITKLTKYGELQI